MDEYIKREDALDAVLFALVGTGLQSSAIYAIRELPTADVVPKSEVERLQKYNTDVAFKHYNDGKKDVAREIFEEIDKFIRTVYEINGKIMDENRFIDLEKCKYLEDIAYGKYCVFEELEDIIAELKKKYTEGET